MPIYLANNTDPILFDYMLPPDRKILLKGSRVLAAIGESYEFVAEEIKRELFVIRYNTFRFSETTSVQSRSGIEGIHSRFMLSNSIAHSIMGLGKMTLEEGQVAALCGGAADCKVTFEDSKEYVALDVFYAPALSEQVVAFFPELKKLLSKNKLGIIGRQPCFITPSMKDVIRQLLECPFDERTRDFYFEIKVRELLFVMLERMYHQSEKKENFTPYETTQVMEARKFLLKDLSAAPITIRDLSRKVAINEFKLKKGFKHFFGVGVFECLQEARMEKARELLLNTNKPLKEICKLTGYPRVTNFITAFRKKFDYPPGELRRMQ